LLSAVLKKFFPALIFFLYSSSLFGVEPFQRLFFKRVFSEDQILSSLGYFSFHSLFAAVLCPLSGSFFWVFVDSRLFSGCGDFSL